MMKTPRDILLARHQSVAPKLDAIRRQIVEGLAPAAPPKPAPAAPATNWLLDGLDCLWRELILPSRRVWAGLAAAWLLIVLVNVSLRDTAPTTGQKPALAAAPMTWQQQQLLAELANPETWRMADRVRTYSPRPRSEYVKISAT